MKKIYYILLLFVSYKLCAQEVSVNAVMDTNSILIGDQAKIELSIKYRVDQGAVHIDFPVVLDTINAYVEVTSKSKIDTFIPDKEDPYLFEQKQLLTITSFDSGYYVIPPFHFAINDSSMQTDVLLLEVLTLEVDTSKAIFDIRSPMQEPFSIVDWLKENMYLLIAVLVIGILLFFAFKYLKNRKPKEIQEEAEPEIPAHVIALTRLTDLQEEKLWQNGKTKRYHSELSEIVREYIENRYAINALEQTTEEILHALRFQVTDTHITSKLNQLLRLSDLVKFAKEKPLPVENETSMADAVEFVESTKEIVLGNNLDEENTVEKKK